LPPETVPKFNKEVAEFFFRKAKKEKDNAKLQMFCIDKAMAFVTEAEHLKMTSDWILSGTIQIEGELLQCELTNEHKYAILKRYYASTHFTLDQKKALKAETFKNDESDTGKQIAKVCDYSLPDAALKEQLWTEIMDPQTKDSLMDTRQKIQGFWQRHQQLELITPYFEKYYNEVNKVVETRDREFAEVFTQSMSPAFMARSCDEACFKELQEKCNKDRDFFVLFLKK